MRVKQQPSDWQAKFFMKFLKAVVGQLVFDEGIIVFFVWSQKN
jgi:hypothetical protein